MDLKCKKTTCRFNHNYSCTAKDILIGKDTECTTYERSNKKSPKNLQDVSKNMFETAPEIDPYRHIRSVNINCNAKNCIFNKDGKCNANGITVLEGKTIGLCGTYIDQ